MSNVIDLKTRMPIVGGEPPPSRDPYSVPPELVVEFYEAPHLRLKSREGAIITADLLRQSAKNMISAAIGMYNSAYTMDRNDEFLPRMMVQLFHSAIIAIDVFNPSGPDGVQSKDDIDWMIKSLPHVADMLTRMKGQL